VLLEGPGNDIVSCTALAAAGAHLILFTTGRGTPLGGPVPTIKIASNTPLALAKKAWIDYDAGKLLEPGNSLDSLATEMLELIAALASGTKRTRNEENGYRQIAVFKNGVTL
jgi:altronate hydrolase